ncbi:hypothetical protein [Tsuneonella mangrovi]|uniref:hypothetical protein n=1 Tax=Tsuneonella mangrovi TaxID=1982042 RepID=UPI0012376641|nr:hypothetical protein [Tsuneonella mangrovi]
MPEIVGSINPRGNSDGCGRWQMKIREEWGSLASLIIGGLAFVGGVAQLTDHHTKGSGIIAGALMVVGALIYRSAKKRRSLEGRSIVRIISEIIGALIILELAFGQNNLKERIANDPVVFVIAIWALIAYGYAAFRSLSSSDNQGASR